MDQEFILKIANSMWQKITNKKNTEINSKDKFSAIEIADFYIYCANILKIFVEGYGFKKSVEKSMPIDFHENPLPLYTYPAIEYLQSINFQDKKIFEFGSGNSSLFWLQKGANVVSVENNKLWFDKLQAEIGNNPKHKLILAQGPNYINSILEDADQYDLIVIDGAENRLKCSENAIKKIKEDGIIIVDNSDWFENSTKFIRDNLDFIQIDFYGFRPSKSNTSVTSIFLSRKVNLQPISQKQPSFAIGGNHRHSAHDLSS